MLAAMPAVWVGKTRIQPLPPECQSHRQDEAWPIPSTVCTLYSVPPVKKTSALKSSLVTVHHDQLRLTLSTHDPCPPIRHSMHCKGEDIQGLTVHHLSPHSSTCPVIVDVPQKSPIAMQPQDCPRHGNKSEPGIGRSRVCKGSASSLDGLPPIRVGPLPSAGHSSRNELGRVWIVRTTA